MVNKSFFYILLVSMSIAVQAAPGCQDNSYHLKEKFDNKEYHYVQCNCPCEKRYPQLTARAQCSKCLHYRVPKEMIIVSDSGDQHAHTDASQEYAHAQTTQDPQLKKIFGAVNYK